MAFIRQTLLLLVALPGMMPLAAAAQQLVGAVGAANGSPTARAPGQPVRSLRPGADIFFKDHIVTRRGGSAQLTFLDRSTLNVSENSDLVIDEFVYKPGATGAMSVTLNKGLARFVGGEISHGGGATVKTPTATIGIRGGIGTVGFVTDAASIGSLPGVPSSFHGGTIIIDGYGTLSVANGAGTVEITRPGFAVFVGSAGQPIGAPTRVDLRAAQAIMTSLTSSRGQHGGAPAKAVAAASRTALSSANVHLADIKVAAPRPPSVNALEFTSVISGANSLVRNQSQAHLAAQLLQAIQSSPSSLVTTSNGIVVTGSAAGGSSGNVAAVNLPAAGSSNPNGNGLFAAIVAAVQAAQATEAAAAAASGHHDNGKGNNGMDNGQGKGNSD